MWELSDCYRKEAATTAEGHQGMAKPSYEKVLGIEIKVLSRTAVSRGVGFSG